MAGVWKKRFCVCDHLFQAHKGYQACDLCECTDYVPATRKWQYNPRVNRFSHPMGKISPQRKSRWYDAL